MRDASRFAHQINLERRFFQWDGECMRSNALRFTVSTLSFGGDHAQQRQLESIFPKRKVFVPFPVPNSVRSMNVDICGHAYERAF
jgi:hypothetical protein